MTPTSDPTPSAGRTWAPMKAVPGELPADDDRWSYEVKWDGMRAIGVVDGGRLRLWSANGREATDRFPELAPLADALGGHSAVVDGEIVALDGRGVPSFGRLQPRIQARSATAVAEGMADAPVAYVLFDLLAVDGTDCTSLPYEDRRRLLVDLFGGGGPSWRVTESWSGGGAALLDEMRDKDMEGLVAKRHGSTYEVGRRSAAWRKIKVRNGQELVVGGWLPGERGRSATFGALLVGYHVAEGDGRPLRYAGRVGTGFADAELRRWATLLGALADDRCPFDPPPPPAVARHARWVRPEPVVMVRFTEWTTDGVLRHPAYDGQRFDKDPGDVVRER